MQYNIRYANKTDIDEIMKFIDAYWKKDHILAKDRSFFEWQYVNYGRVDMVLGLNEREEICGIIGFIPYDDAIDKDFAVSLWVVRKNTSLLGIQILAYLIENEPHRIMFSNRINIKYAYKIYNGLGFITDFSKQWYRLRDKNEYRIAEIKDKKIPVKMNEEEIKWQRVDSISQLKELMGKVLDEKELMPYKSVDYIEKRYFNHPKYEYIIYAFFKDSNKSETSLVFRLQEAKGARVLRVIDILGRYDGLFLGTAMIDAIADEYDVEYSDIYAYGLEDKWFQQSGWMRVGEDNNIIPNYFNPYVKENISIAICTESIGTVLFKGDGDQDRPS